MSKDRACRKAIYVNTNFTHSSTSLLLTITIWRQSQRCFVGSLGQVDFLLGVCPRTKHHSAHLLHEKVEEIRQTVTHSGHMQQLHLRWSRFSAIAKAENQVAVEYFKRGFDLFGSLR